LITSQTTQTDGYVYEIALTIDVPIVINISASGYVSKSVSFTPRVTTLLPVSIQLEEMSEIAVPDNIFDLILSTTYRCDLVEHNSTHNYLVCDANGTYVTSTYMNTTNLTSNISSSVCDMFTAGTVINCSLGNITGKYYTYSFYMLYDGTYILLETGVIDRTVTTTGLPKYEALFFTILALASVSMLFLYNPRMAIIASLVVLWSFRWIGWLSIDITYLFGISFVGILFIIKVR